MPFIERNRNLARLIEPCRAKLDGPLRCRRQGTDLFSRNRLQRAGDRCEQRTRARPDEGDGGDADDGDEGQHQAVFDHRGTLFTLGDPLESRKNSSHQLPFIHAENLARERWAASARRSFEPGLMRDATEVQIERD